MKMKKRNKKRLQHEGQLRNYNDDDDKDKDNNNVDVVNIERAQCSFSTGREGGGLRWQVMRSLSLSLICVCFVFLHGKTPENS